MAEGTATAVAPPATGAPPPAGAQNAPVVVQQTTRPATQAAGATLGAPSTPQAPVVNFAGAPTPRNLTFNSP